MSIIKFFIQSPVERKYIKKIEDEQAEGDRLDSKISDLTTEIESENNKKQNDFKQQNSGKENPEKLLKEIAVHELQMLITHNSDFIGIKFII